MRVQVRHAVPGRLRVALPAWRGDAPRLTQLAQRIEHLKGVTHTRVNTACASLLIEYEPPSAKLEQRLLGWLARDAALERAHGEARLPAASAALALSLKTSTAPLAAAATLYAARGSGRRAWGVLQRERRLNVDVLDVVAIGLSLLRGRVATAALVAWLVNLGDAIRERTAAQAQRSVAQGLGFHAAACWVLRDGHAVRIALQRLRVGDVLLLDAGAVVPADGVVIEGAASIDQRSVSGESLPVDKQPGDAVFAGSLLRAGHVRVRAQRVGAETAIARLVRRVREAPVGETRAQNYAERFGDQLVAPTLGLASGLYALSGDLDRLTSMAIVDYGSGMRVAAPTAILAAIARAAKRGVLFKSGHHLERLAEVDTVVFDKTGTVTLGAPRVTELRSYDARFMPQQLLALAAAAEARVQHPAAEALLTHARELGVTPGEHTHARWEVGLGVEAEVDGWRLHLGNERFLREQAIDCSAARFDLARLHHKAQSSLLLAVGGRLAGLIAYADAVRPEMRSVLAALQRRGVHHAVMLTGDNHTVARAVGGELGFARFAAEMLPDEKARIVSTLRERGHVVAMVGDGINDSAALACADVGVAVCKGADISREAAGVLLLQDDLRKLVSAIDIARHALGLVRQDFQLIAGLNTLALALALPSRRVSPGLIAAISNGSAVLASLNSLRPPPA